MRQVVWQSDGQATYGLAIPSTSSVISSSSLLRVLDGVPPASQASESRAQPEGVSEPALSKRAAGGLTFERSRTASQIKSLAPR